MKYKVSDIERFLVPEEPSRIKQYVVCLMVFMHIPSIVVMICDPFIPYIFNIFLSISVIINLFSVFILRNAGRFQILYSLYIGIGSLAISITYYLCFFKILFIVLKINELKIKYGAFIVYVTLLVAAFILPFYYIKKGYYSSNRVEIGKNSKKITIGSTVGVGVYIGHLFKKYGSYNWKMLALAICCLILSLILILGIPNIHKYFIMKKFIDYVPLYPVEKKKK